MSETHPITRALTAAMRHSAQPMVLTDPRQADNPMIFVNPVFEALTGYAAAETVGHNCRFLQGAETNPATATRIRRCVAEQRGCVEWIVNYRRDGSRFWNLLFISPVFDRDGVLLHFLGNQRDITQGLPDGVPDYVLGKADMPLRGQEEFGALLLDIMEDAPVDGDDSAARARALEQIVEQARRLNDVTIRLEPAPWAPPAGG